jgi:hypothetical protein
LLKHCPQAVTTRNAAKSPVLRAIFKMSHFVTVISGRFSIPSFLPKTAKMAIFPKKRTWVKFSLVCHPKHHTCPSLRFTGTSRNNFDNVSFFSQQWLGPLFAPLGVGVRGFLGCFCRRRINALKMTLRFEGVVVWDIVTRPSAAQ